MPAAHSPPFVLLLDLDHTVIGSTGAQWAQVCVHEAARKLMAAGAVPGSSARTRVDEPDLVPALTEGGVLRPGFAAFVRGLRALLRGTTGTPLEVFVYTNAHAAWAARKVDAVERASGVRFRRPLLSGDPYTLDGVISKPGGEAKVARVKSLRLVLPVIVRSLAKRYPALDARALLRDRLLFIDDTPGNLVDGEGWVRALQLLVPAYKRACNQSPDAQLPARLRRHPHIRALVAATSGPPPPSDDAADDLWPRLLEAAKHVVNVGPGGSRRFPTALLLRKALAPASRT
jgi:hypothetical protein